MILRSSGPLDRLSRILAPSPCGSRDRFDTDEVPALLATADRHNLVPALWSALLAHRSVDPVPLSLRRFVEDRALGSGTSMLAAAAAHAANAERVEDLVDQASTLLAALTGAGVRAAPLKGVDAVLSGRYADPAARTMTDIDILVDPSQAGAAETLIADLGYRPVEGPTTAADGQTEEGHHQLPAVALAGRLGSVELHTALATPRWRSTLDATEALSRATTTSDGTGVTLARTDSAAHLVLHAQLHDEAYLLRRLPLRALHETALLIAGDEPVDWGAVDRCFARVGRRRALRSHLHLAAKLFDVPSPLGAGPATVARSRVVTELDERPEARELVGQVAYLPRALSGERMRQLYGAGDSRSAWRARVTHLARGARARYRG